MTVKNFKIDEDLGLEGYSGTFSFLTPKSGWMDIGEHGSISIPTDSQDFDERILIRLSNRDFQTLSKSAILNHQHSVFRDGILLSNLSDEVTNDYYPGTELSAPHSIVKINMPKTIGKKINIARTDIVTKRGSWDEQLWDSMLKYFYNKYFIKTLDLDPFERLKNLVYLSRANNISSFQLWELYPHEKWPILVLNTGGKIDAIEWGNLDKGKIIFLVHQLGIAIADVLGIGTKEANKILEKWRGEESIIHNTSSGVVSSRTTSLLGAYGIFPIRKTALLDRIKFVSNPFKDVVPWVQEIWSIPKSGKGDLTELETEQFLSRVVENPKLILGFQSFYEYRFRFSIYLWGEVVKFSQPYQSAFAYGNKYINIEHPTTQMLIKLQSCIELVKINRSLSADIIGTIEDKFHQLKFPSDKSNIKKFLNQLQEFLIFVRSVDLINFENVDNLLPKIDDFILYKGSILMKVEDLISENTFGEPIK